MALTKKQKRENADRAQRARNIMDAYSLECGVSHPDDAPLQDLLADMMHRCAADGHVESFDDALRMARQHFDAESQS